MPGRRRGAQPWRSVSGMGRAEIGMVFDRAFPAAAIGEYARRVEVVRHRAALDHRGLLLHRRDQPGRNCPRRHRADPGRHRHPAGGRPATRRSPRWRSPRSPNIAPGGSSPASATGCRSGWGRWVPDHGLPLTTLDETIRVVKRLLAGEEVTFDGRLSPLDHVRLDQPPTVAPRDRRRGPAAAKSLALAGRVADGMILVEGAGPTYVEWALEPRRADPDTFQVVTFTMMAVRDDRRRRTAGSARSSPG